MSKKDKKKKKDKGKKKDKKSKKDKKLLKDKSILDKSAVNAAAREKSPARKSPVRATIKPAAREDAAPVPVQPPEPPKPIAISCMGRKLDSLLGLEWLRTNSLGAYSSSTVAGCNTRRYHGLLVASAPWPVGRMTALSSLMEWLDVGEQTYELGCNEFVGDFAPKGYEFLDEFIDGDAATFIYRVGGAKLTKQVIIAENSNAIAVRYTINGSGGRLRIRPFAALRNFHHLRTLDDPEQFTLTAGASGVVIQDEQGTGAKLHVKIDAGTFDEAPAWWKRFLYRVDIYRGQDGFEDIFSPGELVADLDDGQSVQITACLGESVSVNFDKELSAKKLKADKLTAAVGRDKGDTIARLAMATDAFVINRPRNDAKSATTILAGYHWFADWGRDAFIALPGLLLSTWQFGKAREVFSTFADAISEGMVPNRFDDEEGNAHYNSMDASLWFVIAAERYIVATGDMDFWRKKLLPACEEILTRYRAGTRFGIHADSDGLLAGGDYDTQLTWMDASLGGQAVTPRHGKPVEINALWYCAHRIMNHRLADIDDEKAAAYASMADEIALAFERTFWNEHDGCLFDCITESQQDAAIRPNQIFAVSLPHSPLGADKQSSVVNVVGEQLLTPFGLRSLSPKDSRYRRRYGGSWESRDRAYHQGTVWAWLIGPFVEAYLKVNGSTPDIAKNAGRMLESFDGHLKFGCLSQVAEIFDGDPPNLARGCVAQAWSVAELLRAKLLIADILK